MMQEEADLVVALLPGINHRSLLLFLRFSVWIGAHPWPFFYTIFIFRHAALA